MALMLDASQNRIEEEVAKDALVLDVGGWAKPWPRADWVLDLMPHETRGLYGPADPTQERFSADTWVCRDICDRQPWPFDDDQFDFVVCSHTLEDVRDPVWVCSELARVAQAGYIEIPARSEEQTRGVHGPWVGWSHHHWMADIEGDSIEFVLKPHLLHGRPEFWVDRDWLEALAPALRVSEMFWRGSFDYRERLFYSPDELHLYLESVFERYVAPAAPTTGRSKAMGVRGRVRSLLDRTS